MHDDVPAYGLWSLVFINSAIFIFFAFSFFKPQTKRDWRSFSAFSAYRVFRVDAGGDRRGDRRGLHARRPPGGCTQPSPDCRHIQLHHRRTRYGRQRDSKSHAARLRAPREATGADENRRQHYLWELLRSCQARDLSYSAEYKPPGERAAGYDRSPLRPSDPRAPALKQVAKLACQRAGAVGFHCFSRTVGRSGRRKPQMADRNRRRSGLLKARRPKVAMP